MRRDRNFYPAKAGKSKVVYFSIENLVLYRVTGSSMGQVADFAIVASGYDG